MTTTLSMDLCLESESTGDDPESPFRILVVDDECSIRELIAETLGEAGYVVETAANALEALERLHGRHHDLLLTDYHMPRMNGLELISRIRAEGLDIPAVLMTGRSADLLAQYPDLPVSSVLSKPFMIDELLDVILRALASGKHTQAPAAPAKSHPPRHAEYAVAGDPFGQLVPFGKMPFPGFLPPNFPHR
jgi:CheY-like chemotaxis protein